ncbi:MAG: BlaI/MecI/CopY family transcriptional regulator [Firmicutes bacterium]|nr:BlaI/MecI/CopY family transcriptional regulator [Bacillota bacterium]
MNGHKLPESELKVMDHIWAKGESTAKETAAYMEEKYGWKKNTTYTVLKNLSEKGVLERKDPGFKVVPLVGREEVGRTEARSLLDKFYNGSVAGLFSAFLNDNVISEKEMKELKELLDRE